MKYSLILTAALVAGSSAHYHHGQCGGKYWHGSTHCHRGFVCTIRNPWFSQCVPESGNGGESCGGPTTMATMTSGSAATTNSLPAPAYTRLSPANYTLSSSTSASPTPQSSPGSSSSRVQFAGVNIAGFDFGCGGDGSCIKGDTSPPILPGADGAGQMAHFVKDDNMNIFRLPVSWQYLVNSNLGGPLDPTNFPVYDTLVQSCLDTGASCIIDIHNYARWNGAIVGQGGPTDDQLANVWSQLATNYKSEDKIIFGVMNEPHDMPSMPIWAVTVQASVNAIRAAGALSQMILLPGNNYTGAATFISDGSLAALQTVKNPDGSTTNLVYDIHKYLSGGDGTSPVCTTNNIDDFTPLAAALRAANRQALLTETGGGSTPSCQMYLCQQTQYLNQNADVFLGYLGWAAGAFSPFDPSTISLVPVNNNGVWTDSPILAQCLAPPAS